MINQKSNDPPPLSEMFEKLLSNNNFIASSALNIASNQGMWVNIYKKVVDYDFTDLFETIEAILVQAADAVSASRPGARRETLTAYIKRLEGLEEIANSFDGVESSYAIQAGRELRIVINPDKIDDDEAVLMSREVAKKIQDTMQYPGQIKVTILRETRAVEYAK